LANSDDGQLTLGAEGDSVCCSFCTKETATVGELIEGPVLTGGTRAYICQECVELCSSIFGHRKLFGGDEEQADGCITSAATKRLLEEKIDQALSILTSLEDDIIRLRYGLTHGYSYSLNEVGEMMGLAPERVAEIEARAVAKLRPIGPQG
jgi:RNA polymerase sigma factor (sigma-70 family)